MQCYGISKIPLHIALDFYCDANGFIDEEDYAENIIYLSLLKLLGVAARARIMVI